MLSYLLCFSFGLSLFSKIKYTQSILQWFDIDFILFSFMFCSMTSIFTFSFFFSIQYSILCVCIFLKFVYFYFVCLCVCFFFGSHNQPFIALRICTYLCLHLGEPISSFCYCLNFNFVFIVLCVYLDSFVCLFVYWILDLSFALTLVRY